VVCERFLNVQTSTQRDKKLTDGRVASGDRGPSHGTTGTMVNPALIAGHSSLPHFNIQTASEILPSSTCILCKLKVWSD